MTDDDPIPPKALARRNSALVALDHAGEADDIEAFRTRLEDARDLVDEGLEVLEDHD